MNLITIKKKTESIIDGIVAHLQLSSDQRSYNDKLALILSESTQVLELVTTIEEEFDISFDDDEINIDFFENIDEICANILNHVR